MKTPETKSPCVNTILALSAISGASMNHVLPRMRTERIKVPNEDLQQQRLAVKNKRRAKQGLPPIEHYKDI